MFGIGWAEMLIVLVVAVVVIGPKDMPRALHALGKLARKARRFAADMQASFDRIVHDEELNEIMREANKPGGDNLQFEIERQYMAEQQRKNGASSPEEGDKKVEKKDATI